MAVFHGDDHDHAVEKTQMMVDETQRVKAINVTFQNSIVAKASSDVHNEGWGIARIDMFEDVYNIKHEIVVQISMLVSKNLHRQSHRASYNRRNNAGRTT